MKYKSVLLLIISLLSYVAVSAQNANKWGISTNVLGYAALSPNLQGERYLGKRWSVSFGVSYGWWGFDWSRKSAFQQWNVGMGGKYYLKDDASFLGHHLGLDIKTGEFDRKKDDYGYKGNMTTFGFSYGYTWRLNELWHIDAGVGLGYQNVFYHKYTYNEKNGCFDCVFHETKHKFGITSLNVSFVYRFKNRE